MTSEQQAVEEFHRAFDITIHKQPTLPSEKDQELRVELIREELKELEDAFKAGDMVEVADALADLQYVVLGAAVTCGIELWPVFREVHRSNMTKVGGHKGPNGKWIKPATYDPAKIEPILRQQGWQG